MGAIDASAIMLKGKKEQEDAEKARMDQLRAADSLLLGATQVTTMGGAPVASDPGGGDVTFLGGKKKKPTPYQSGLML